MTDQELTTKIHSIDFWIGFSKWAGITLGLTAVGFALKPLTWCEKCVYNEYGDWVGGVSGSIISAAAMAFVYMTFLSQRKQIVIQQNEIAKRENEAKLKPFVDSYFSTVSLHNETVRNLDLRKKDDLSKVIAVGKECFNQIHKEFIEQCDAVNADICRAAGVEASHNAEMLRSQSITIFNRIYDEYEADLSEYFRSIGNVLYVIERIETSKLVNNVEDFILPFKMSLNGVETALVFYYLKLPDDKRTFDNLVVRMHRRLMTHFVMTEYVSDVYLARVKEGNLPR